MERKKFQELASLLPTKTVKATPSVTTVEAGHTQPATEDVLSVQTRKEGFDARGQKIVNPRTEEETKGKWTERTKTPHRHPCSKTHLKPPWRMD